MRYPSQCKVQNAIPDVSAEGALSQHRRTSAFGCVQIHAIDMFHSWLQLYTFILSFVVWGPGVKCPCWRETGDDLIQVVRPPGISHSVLQHRQFFDRVNMVFSKGGEQSGRLESSQTFAKPDRRNAENEVTEFRGGEFTETPHFCILTRQDITVMTRLLVASRRFGPNLRNAERHPLCFPHVAYTRSRARCASQCCNRLGKRGVLACDLHLCLRPTARASRSKVLRRSISSPFDRLCCLPGGHMSLWSGTVSLFLPFMAPVVLIARSALARVSSCPGLQHWSLRFPLPWCTPTSPRLLSLRPGL